MNTSPNIGHASVQIIQDNLPAAVWVEDLTLAEAIAFVRSIQPDHAFVFVGDTYTHGWHKSTGLYKTSHWQE